MTEEDHQSSYEEEGSCDITPSQESDSRMSVSDGDPASDHDDEMEEERLPFLECLSKALGFKDAGNAAFKEKDFAQAQKLYEDGISLLAPHKDMGGASDEVSEEHYTSMMNTYVGTQGNLCLLHVKQENWTGVMTSAQEVLKYDAVNVKAHYRRGIALRTLGNLEESKSALARAIELDPSNSAAKKELSIVIKDIKAKKQKEKAALAGAFSSGSMYNDKEKEREAKLRKAREEEEKLQDDYVKSKLRRREEGKSEQTFEEYKAERKKEEEERKKDLEEQQKKNAPARSNVTPKKSKPVESDSEEEYDEEEQKIISETKKKGYCYFKNKLDDKTSQLIGDITPKAAQMPASLPTASTASGKVGASDWNHAGTWEERDMTDLTKDQIKKACLGVNVSLSSAVNESTLSDTLSSLSTGDLADRDSALNKSLEEVSSMMATVKGYITEVKSVDGDAQIVIVGQGKKRQIYDFNVSLKFEVSVEDISGDSAKNKKYKGSFDVMDIAPGSTYEHKTSFKKGGSNQKVDAAVQQLREKVIDRIQTFFQKEFSEL